MTKKVLIVGDTPRWINTVKSVLGDTVEIYTATDYINALGLLFNSNPEAEIRFDLHIVGNRLPEMHDGVRLLREIREDGRMEPFVIFSDHIDEETTTACQKLDAPIIKRRDGATTLRAAISSYM